MFKITKHQVYPDHNLYKKGYVNKPLEEIEEILALKGAKLKETIFDENTFLEEKVYQQHKFNSAGEVIESNTFYLEQVEENINIDLL